MPAPKQNIVVPVLAVAVVGGGLYWYLQHKKTTENAEFHNLKVKIIAITKQGGDNVVNIKILNPNSVKMEVKSFVGTVTANGKPVGDINMFGDYIANGNTEISIPLILKLKAPAKGKIKFTGKINVNDHLLPLTLNYGA